ncbi:hypothetical protein M758_1G080900 [Ceratodon purpureus]|uniref:Uncharacterized protein n=1 Tax=Ceratodon purpureus TaxID=3225 RepID=A0A8T0J2S6_CERPU|nr:hypothetical protein KC19_1G082500 [Ceratodon purpureus]KAG0629154.1 hypothetical protein M758_1G080900 [Ceratodon purpureus]
MELVNKCWRLQLFDSLGGHYPTLALPGYWIFSRTWKISSTEAIALWFLELLRVSTSSSYPLKLKHILLQGPKLGIHQFLIWLCYTVFKYLTLFWLLLIQPYMSRMKVSESL